MPLYAGAAETNITPPPGVWMSGYAMRKSEALGIHDELYARALVADDGSMRVVLLAIDVIALDIDIVRDVRDRIAVQHGTDASAVMLHCTHTHAGPCTRSYRGMGTRDDAYIDILTRKLVGVAAQAAAALQPANLTYGEATAQIGVNRRQRHDNGSLVIGADYAGPVDSRVQTLCVTTPDGRLFAQLFCHACHPTTLGGENLQISGEWPGAAVQRLKDRFRDEADQNGVQASALPFALQGCCGDVNPLQRGSWDAIEHNGRVVADAAHTARWNAHGRLDESLAASEETIELPMLPPPSIESCDRQITEWEAALARDRAACADAGRIMFDQGRLAWAQSCRKIAGQDHDRITEKFAIQALKLGGIYLLGFPAEMFITYQLDFSAQSRLPVMSLAYTNGCHNYLPTAAEYPRGGYEVSDAYRYYGTLMYGPESEAAVRKSVYSLLEIEEPDTAPYPIGPGRRV